MTTWHDDEPIESALDFFLDWPREESRRIAFVVGERAILEQVRRRLAQRQCELPNDEPHP